MASITKLMTALVALEHASLDDVATISRHTASVGESTINLRPGERVTLRDLIRAALVQSANDAANAIAAFVGRGSVGRFVELMNARAARARAHRHALRQPGRPRRARPRLERPRRDQARARRDARCRSSARRCDWSTRPRPDAACTPGTTCSRPSRTCSASRPGTRTAPAGRRSPRRVAAASRSTRPCSAARRARAATPTCRQLLLWGLSRYRTVWAIDGDEDVRHGADRVREARGARRRRQAGAARDPRRAAARRARRPPRRGGAARAEGAAARRGAGARPRHRDRALAARRRGRRRAAGGARTRRLLCRTDARPPRGATSDDRHRHAERSARPHAHRAALPPRASATGRARC